MSVLFSAHELRKSFAARPLFDGLTFSVESGERIGLIGPNGAGKSTLLRILAGEASPDSGTVSLQRGLVVGFLPQLPTFEPGALVFGSIISGAKDPDDWEAHVIAHELISRMGLDLLGETETLLVEELSGGWRKRVALARELVRKPDLLLLDEPTNHLDVAGILWLEDFLAQAPFATVTVTHDRAFLQKVSNRILELDRRNAGGILSIKGDYADYLEAKEGLLNAQVSREVILKNTLRRETEWLKRGAKARTTKQQARIQRHGELSDDVAELETRNRVRNARIDFQSTDRSPKRLVEGRKLSKTFAGAPLFSELDVLLTPGTRIGLLGNNGCGKSTLIRVLLGEIEPDSGEVLRSDLLKVAYFEQNRESLNPKLSLAKTLCPTGDFVDFRGGRVHIRSYLDRFLFTPEQAEMAVGKLSGGEQSRILLARLMLEEANLLVLDEPTNDLDMATLNILEDCLMDFPGAVLLVTHDRYFLDQVATKILAFESGEVTSFADLSQWEVWKRESTKAAAKAARGGGGSGGAASPAPQTSKNQASKNQGSNTSGSGPGNTGNPAKETRTDVPRASAATRKLSFNEKRELETMEPNILKLESEISRLDADAALPDNQSNATKLTTITSELASKHRELERLFARWAELQAAQGT